jgi:hypothetical protein
MNLIQGEAVSIQEDNWEGIGVVADADGCTKKSDQSSSK